MVDRKDSEILREARDLILDKKNWIQGRSRLDNRRCAFGALEDAVKGNKTWSEYVDGHVDGLLRRLTEVLNLEADKFGLVAGSDPLPKIVRLNDQGPAEERFAAVHRAYELAIKTAEEEESGQ